MPRTPVPDYLIHKPEETAENAALFDTFAELVPQEVILVEPIWSAPLMFEDSCLAEKAGQYDVALLAEMKQENEEHQKREQKTTVTLIASRMIEKIREIVEKEGKFDLPFGLIVIKLDQSPPV